MQCNMDIKKNDKFRHFKGKIVEVIEIGKDSETLEDLIIYKHIDDDVIWVRPKEMFASKVNKIKYPNVKQEYRFEKIN